MVSRRELICKDEHQQYQCVPPALHRESPQRLLQLCHSKSSQSHKEQKLNGIKQYVNQLRKSLLPQQQSLLSLTDLPLSELQSRLRSNQINPLDLLHAFQLKAANLYEKGNSGICEFIHEAEHQAQSLTGDAASFNSELYGIPVSVKELCCVQGYDATFGLLKLCGQPAAEDCVLVKTLRQAGAIPFVLTATSHLALTTSGVNPVFGDMHNPYSTRHEPGGSSTGEALLLAQNGSPVGLGTDIAGSIRIPSAFCGLAGLKPTSTRLSSLGLAELFPQSVICLSVTAGPMGRRVEDLAKVMLTLLGPVMFQLDSSIPVLPFKKEVYQGEDKSNLLIGYYDTLSDPDITQTVPSVRRGILRAVEILRRRGHRVLQFTPPEPSKALRLGLRALCVDGGRAISDWLANEPHTPQTKAVNVVASLPNSLRWIVDAIARRFIGRPAAVSAMVRMPSGVSDLMKLVLEIRAYRRCFETAWMQAGDFDAVLCPVWAYPAYPREMPVFYANPPVLYTLLYNLLDYPAGVVPMGTVSREDVEVALQMAEKCKAGGDKFHEKVLRYQNETENLPLSVQVVSKPFREEVVLRVMRELEVDRESVTLPGLF
ncbi:unnamed protein product [Dicrocoelium dendriticum]|nr:unnamed protein product [Dicrocoelium dendriticum]